MPILLRPWTPADADDLSRAARAGDDLGPQFGGTDLTRVSAAQGFIERHLRFDDAAKNWAVEIDGRAVGNVAATGIEFRHQTAWMSYWLAPFARGRGVAVASLARVSDWAFRIGLHRLELGHRVNNPASCRVAHAAGYLAEGVERDKLRYGDERHDVETHARLATDPRPPERETAVALRTDIPARRQT
ncbi:RimJ/RimL family protein N-acetyltransferase [Microbacterium sp. SORGH_AS 505]|uniref:GNAT family N-acetyltransferase n=1 Tax=Microbacterium sp. SORGH_AS_0505 TaxID=3041770 RepID=UPI002781E9A6|nr:GNAT family protein [Microbacterium sp. SORGH_AS_0505]MDQ1125161.1 RimJ/RimL family protein N-acetyltransferase [Microbacterium sp. SORGH_AS_0505]